MVWPVQPCIFDVAALETGTVLVLAVGKIQTMVVGYPDQSRWHPPLIFGCPMIVGTDNIDYYDYYYYLIIITIKYNLFFDYYFKSSISLYPHSNCIVSATASESS